MKGMKSQRRGAERNLELLQAGPFIDNKRDDPEGPEVVKEYAMQ
jgi:hypothetical protein